MLKICVALLISASKVFIINYYFFNHNQLVILQSIVSRALKA